jgi:hypothetical protein
MTVRFFPTNRRRNLRRLFGFLIPGWYGLTISFLSGFIKKPTMLSNRIYHKELSDFPDQHGFSIALRVDPLHRHLSFLTTIRNS